MKTILFFILLFSSTCFAQRDSTLYKVLNSEITNIQKQIDASTEINLKLINLFQQKIDYQNIILFIQQTWYQEDLKRK